MFAYKLVNRVVQVRVKGFDKPFVIRPRELHAMDGDPYFECDCKTIEAVGKGYASTYKKIKIRDIQSYEFMDTPEQGDLRHYRLWYDSIGVEKLGPEERALLEDVMSTSIKKYEYLKGLDIEEFDF